MKNFFKRPKWRVYLNMGCMKAGYEDVYAWTKLGAMVKAEAISGLWAYDADKLDDITGDTL